MWAQSWAHNGTINKTNADGRNCTSCGRVHLEGNHDSTPWIWSRDHVAVQTYTYTISLPTHCCPTFKDMISKLIRKQNYFLHCKHLYFIFVKVSNLDPDVDLFIHAPTFSFNEVKLILKEAS